MLRGAVCFCTGGMHHTCEWREEGGSEIERGPEDERHLRKSPST